MFISQLKNKLYRYDKYGVHRTNGLKALYLVELLLVFELFSGMFHFYFYYFFAPLTCLAAEMTGNTLEEKNWSLFWCYIALIIAIFCFGVLSIYKTFFLFFVFFFSASLYYLIIQKDISLLVIVPLVLAVASYSLTYLKANSNFYIALNHSLYTFAAMVVIFIGLLFFPRTYYLSIWRRAFLEGLKNLETFCNQWVAGKSHTVPIVEGVVIMERYSNMIPKQRSYSVLKITVLMFELIMSMSYLTTFQKSIHRGYILVLQSYLSKFYLQCLQNKPLIMTSRDIKKMAVTPELIILYRLILSWNYLCRR